MQTKITQDKGNFCFAHLLRYAGVEGYRKNLNCFMFLRTPALEEKFRIRRKTARNFGGRELPPSPQFKTSPTGLVLALDASRKFPYIEIVVFLLYDPRTIRFYNTKRIRARSASVPSKNDTA